MNQRSRGMGFTLLEVVVVLVILILVVLALIFLPVMERTRGYANHQTQCVSNIRRIVIGLKTYTDDYDNKFPAVHDGSMRMWTVVMDPYVKSPGILACPSAGATQAKPFSYFFNRRLSGKVVSAVRYRSNCISIGEWVPYGKKDVATSTTWDIARSEHSRPDGSWEAGDRHSPGAIYGFVDGHAKNLRRTDILPAPVQASSPPAGYGKQPSLYP